MNSVQPEIPRAQDPGTARMPPGIPYIVGNEAAERFNFYGMRAILVVFMTQYLLARNGTLALMGENEASGWFHLFIAGNYFFPLFGSIVADAWWGKYSTIFRLSIVYCLGNAALAIDNTRTGLAVGLSLIAIGAGGIKPCVSANVGDQFGPSNSHLISKAFGWFYFSVNAGSFVSIGLIPIVLAHWGPHVAFAIPGVLMLAATVIFWAGRNRFVRVPPQGREYFRKTFTWEGLRLVLRLASIFAFVAVFWSLWDQSGGEWVLQAAKMDLHFAWITWLPSQVQVLNAVLILIFIPLFNYLVYPAISRIFPLTQLRKIGLGILVIGLSFLVSAWIESLIAHGQRPNIVWQFPAYMLLTAGEVMTSITALEFAYTQAPKHMKSTVSALYLLSISAGNAFTALVHWAIQNPDGSAKLEGPAYYLFFACLAIAAAGVFTFFARRYRGQTFFQDEVASVSVSA